MLFPVIVARRVEFFFKIKKKGGEMGAVKSQNQKLGAGPELLGIIRRTVPTHRFGVARGVNQKPVRIG